MQNMFNHLLFPNLYYTKMQLSYKYNLLFIVNLIIKKIILMLKLTMFFLWKFMPIVMLIMLFFNISFNSNQNCYLKIMLKSMLNHFKDMQLMFLTYKKEKKSLYNYSNNNNMSIFFIKSNAYNKLSLLFLILLIINLYGLLPHTWCYNTFPINTLSLTMVIFMVTNVMFMLNLLNSLKGKYKNLSFMLCNFFPSGTPLWLAFVMMPIEIISYFMSPLSMGFRICGNLMAGHMLMGLMLNLMFYLMMMSNMLVMKMVSISLMVLFYCMLFFMELCVAFIQSYVLTLLASTFLKETEELH